MCVDRHVVPDRTYVFFVRDRTSAGLEGDAGAPALGTDALPDTASGGSGWRSTTGMCTMLSKALGRKVQLAMLKQESPMSPAEIVLKSRKVSLHSAPFK